MVCGGDVDGVVDVGVGADALDQAAVLQLVEQAAVAADVVVLQVDQLHPGVAERQVVALAVRLDELVLDDPVDLAVELERVVLDGGHAVLPHLERLLLQRREALGLGVAERPVEVLALDVERATPRARWRGAPGGGR